MGCRPTTVDPLVRFVVPQRRFAEGEVKRPTACALNTGGADELYAKRLRTDVKRHHFVASAVPRRACGGGEALHRTT
jgi:hypothetical protein